MKEILSIVILFFVSQNFAFSQQMNCDREANFGEKQICLPQIDGYQECYTDSIVKQLADATEVSMNSVLGFYLNNETYDKKDSLGIINFDDYFKVYGTNEIQNYNADEALLEQMIQVLSGNFINKNWEEMSNEVDKLGFDVEVGVPILIDNYRINSESFSIVLITKYAFEGIEPYTLAMTMNGYLINERLVWMAYYLNYEDQETINILKNKSNFILQKLTETRE